MLDFADKDDLVYFDPPYLPISDTSNFTSYSSNGFSWDDQLRLKEVCQKLCEKGVYFVLSNSYVEQLLAIYMEIESFRVEIVTANRAINSKASNRGAVKELLITNIPEN
ncbi:hypothetical protein FJY84_00095 [Candidatus Bathyarchaeota archaeon]|nr:hypothetical protein [Candidatus Bathyarchaeota archaeon]